MTCLNKRVVSALGYTQLGVYIYIYTYIHTIMQLGFLGICL